MILLNSVCYNCDLHYLAKVFGIVVSRPCFTVRVCTVNDSPNETDTGSIIGIHGR